MRAEDVSVVVTLKPRLARRVADVAVAEPTVAADMGRRCVMLIARGLEASEQRSPNKARARQIELRKFRKGRLAFWDDLLAMLEGGEIDAAAGVVRECRDAAGVSVKRLRAEPKGAKRPTALPGSCNTRAIAPPDGGGGDHEKIQGTK